jgi:predicted esterase
MLQAFNFICKTLYYEATDPSQSPLQSIIFPHSQIHRAWKNWDRDSILSFIQPYLKQRLHLSSIFTTSTFFIRLSDTSSSCSSSSTSTPSSYQCYDIPYILILPPYVDTSKENILFVFCHGNAATVPVSINELLILYKQSSEQLEQKYNVFVTGIEYHGYFESEGMAKEQTDIDKLLLFQQKCILSICQTYDISLSNLVLIGHSIGTGVCCNLANCYFPECLLLVLINPFMTICDLCNHVTKFPFTSMLCAERFDNIKHIKEMQTNICIFHSRHDSSIPYHHSTSLFSVIREHKIHINPTKKYELHLLKGEHNYHTSDSITNYQNKYSFVGVVNSIIRLLQKL